MRYAFVAVALAVLATGCARTTIIDATPRTLATAPDRSLGEPAIWAGALVGEPGLASSGFVARALPSDGLWIHDFDGAVVQHLAGSANGVSVAAMPLADSFTVALATTERAAGGTNLVIYRLERGDGERVQRWIDIVTDLEEPRGVCMRQWNGVLRAVVVDRHGDGRLYSIQADAGDQALVETMGSFHVTGEPTGCAVDVGAMGVWISTTRSGFAFHSLRQPSPPAIPSSARKAASQSGVALLGDGRDYLLTIDASRSAVSVWTTNRGQPTFVGRFRLRDPGGRIVRNLTGVDGYGGRAGPYESGLLVAQSFDQRAQPQMTYIDWSDVERALGL